MNQKGKVKLIKEKISSAELTQYLCAEWGNYLAIYDTGQVVTGQDVGQEIDPKERPFSLIKCPGIDNSNFDFYTDDWTTYDNETGIYTVIEDGRKLTLEQCIAESCEKGDVNDEIEHLQQLLFDNIIL